MDIFYTNETLYVNLNDKVTTNLIMSMKSKVFKIIKDYDIDNIVLNTGGFAIKDEKYLNEFVSEYQKLHSGNLKIM